MRRLCLGLSLVAALLAAGCAGDPTTSALEELKPAAAESDAGAAQKIADELFGEAIGPDNRAVRLCMIGSGVVELMTDRVVMTDTSYAPTAFGQIAAVRGALASIDSSPGNIWFETDVKLVTLGLAAVIVEAGKDRVPRLLGNLAGGVNVLGVLDRASVAARQASLAEAVVLDVRRVILEIGKGTLSAEAARAGCNSRIERNEARIRAVIAGPPAIASPAS